MTPKEKAKELVRKFEPFLIQGYGDLDGYNVAKQCALISVELMLQPFLLNYEIIDHWKEVKNEIEKL